MLIYISPLIFILFIDFSKFFSKINSFIITFKMSLLRLVIFIYQLLYIDIVEQKQKLYYLYFW